jgi:hypothetical protein
VCSPCPPPLVNSIAMMWTWFCTVIQGRWPLTARSAGCMAHAHPIESLRGNKRANYRPRPRASLGIAYAKTACGCGPACNPASLQWRKGAACTQTAATRPFPHKLPLQHACQQCQQCICSTRVAAAEGQVSSRRQQPGAQLASALSPILVSFGIVMCCPLLHGRNGGGSRQLRRHFGLSGTVGGLEATDCARGFAAGGCMPTMITT